MKKMRFSAVLILMVGVLLGLGKNDTHLNNNVDPGVMNEDVEISVKLFDLLITEAKTHYADALIASYHGDTTEVNYCVEKVLEVITEIGELDTLTKIQKDEFDRFYERFSYDFQDLINYINGDSGSIDVSQIRDELTREFLDTVDVGYDTLIILEDEPGHLPIVTNRKIKKIINFYCTRERDNFQKWLNRSGRYRDIMVPILRSYGLPDEIFYLALIESGFSPFAYSYAHAVGPWQFVTGTAAKYGLKRNWWVDERRDFIKSTHAAAKYLRDLYKEFNDWFLALAAYNCGELNVLRAIRREGTRDFWKLQTLPRQTRNYIPNLMAAIIIAKNPEKYGFEYKPLPRLQWDEVILDKSYDLEAIARVTGIPAKTLKEYNPELRRWMTPPDVKEYVLRVPYGKGEHVRKNLKKIPHLKTGPRWIVHRVRRGQTLWYIARKYGTTVSAIVSANKIRNENQIKVGQKLLIPIREYRGFTSGKKKIVHVVKKGESLYLIARKYRVSVRQLIAWNNLYGRRYIYPGQRLYIYKSYGS
ncbi:MAG: LysM peptidoglycan-binding domain-containing protein [Candidatus Marinimicrobia bacterium]|nr:LysM peptidoglycan-binding domain-containing protein [Candidatus Neomarinimicrobiota bacterium]